MSQWIFNHRKVSTVILVLLLIIQQLVISRVSDGWGVLISGIYVGVVVLVGVRLLRHKMAQYNRGCHPDSSLFSTRRKSSPPSCTS